MNYSRSTLAGSVNIDVDATAAEGPAWQGAPVLTRGMVDPTFGEDSASYYKALVAMQRSSASLLFS